MKQGLIHIYTGDGKGKTTASMGLLFRAAGRGFKIVLVQFLKGRETGELSSIALLPNVTVLRNSRDYGFFSSASETGKAEMFQENNANLAEAFRLAGENGCDLLVLDEFFAAYNLKAIDMELAEKLIFNKPPGMELVLTGRNAPPRFIDAADYVTELVKHKHPYDAGINAREGIEY